MLAQALLSLGAPRFPMKTKIVIECSGGVVTSVYSNSDVEITLLDWDEVEEGGEAEHIPAVSLDNLPSETKALLK